MIHSFDIELAQEFGLDEAIMISNFQFWISKNIANGRHEYEGRFWTYNSIPAFVKIFPYWTEKQVRRILDSLVVQGVLIKGNHGKNGYDRTLWYAFLDESKFLKRQNDMPKRADGSAETGNCITDTNTVSFTNNNLFVQPSKPTPETVEQRKQKFAQKMEPWKETYTREMLNDFYLYWTEKGEQDRKMRFEKEKVFEVERRLQYWKKIQDQKQNRFQQVQTPPKIRIVNGKFK